MLTRMFFEELLSMECIFGTCVFIVVILETVLDSAVGERDRTNSCTKYRDWWKTADLTFISHWTPVDNCVYWIRRLDINRVAFRRLLCKLCRKPSYRDDGLSDHASWTLSDIKRWSLSRKTSNLV